MIGQTAATNIVRTRWGNTRLALRHFVHKETPKASQYGAIGGSFMGAISLDGANGLEHLLRPIPGAIVGTVATNGIAAGYRALRMLFRNPNSEKTLAQVAKWEQELQEAGTPWFSKLFRRNKKKLKTLNTKA